MSSYRDCRKDSARARVYYLFMLMTFSLVLTACSDDKTQTFSPTRTTDQSQVAVEPQVAPPTVIAEAPDTPEPEPEQEQEPEPIPEPEEDKCQRISTQHVESPTTDSGVQAPSLVEKESKVPTKKMSGFTEREQTNVIASDLSTLVDESILSELMQTKKPFDWNTVSDDVLCRAMTANALEDNVVNQHQWRITLGVKHDGNGYERNLHQVVSDLTNLSDNIQIPESINSRLGILKVSIDGCDHLMTIRNMALIEFVDIEYRFQGGYESDSSIAARTVAMSNSERVPTDVDPCDTEETDVEEEVFHPRLWDAEESSLTYVEYMESVDSDDAIRIRRHNLDEVYDTYDYFGVPEIGVAVVDNGVLPEDVDYLAFGDPEFATEAYYRPINTILAGQKNDGIHPQDYDLFGITKAIGSMINHGTRQAMHVMNMAPNVNITSARAASFVVWLIPSHIDGVVSALESIAENPDVKIISMSMGTLFAYHEVSRAIDYVNSQDKILISAAGTTFPVIKDIVNVVYPASLPTTVSATGIQDTEENDGNFKLGKEAHGGPENDFVTEPSNASSEAVSTTAGMFAVIWSINPALNRQEVIDIMVEASNFYRERGEKHPVFGWGKVDMMIAADLARETIL